jgi:hypothetical protein
VIPDDAMLADAYRRFHQQALVQRRIDEVVAEMKGKEAKEQLAIPADLRSRIADEQAQDRQMRWDDVVSRIARVDLRKEAQP